MTSKTRTDRDGRSVAILVNIIAPYRVPIYQAIGRSFETTVYPAGQESNRSDWDQLGTQARGFEVKRPWGVTLYIGRRKSKGRSDPRYLHITPGYLLALLRDRPGAVITNEMGIRTLIGLSYGSLFGKPVWVWWGGTQHTERRVSGPKRALRRLISRWARRWISYGKTSTEYLLSMQVPRARVLEIQNCVDESLFQQPVKPAFDLDTRPALLYVGQMIGRKGVDLLLEACARVQRRGRRFSLALVGDGPDRARLQARAASLGLRDVHFFPARPPSEMPAVYRSGDCLVFPTLEDVWGLAVNEALWSGLPVLGSIYAGCAPELLPPENRFDPLNPEDFDNALVRTLAGNISRTRPSNLKAMAEVSAMIVGALELEVNRASESVR